MHNAAQLLLQSARAGITNIQMNICDKESSANYTVL